MNVGSCTYELIGRSTRSPAHDLNEDVFGFVADRDVVSIWVIDGAKPIPPATNRLVYDFVHAFTEAIEVCASVSPGPVEVARNAILFVRRQRVDVVEAIENLPSYARPLASLSLVQIDIKNSLVTYLAMGDCAIWLTRPSCIVLKRARAESRVASILGANDIEDADRERLLQAHLRNRRRRQIKRDYCRWLSLHADGTSRAAVGQKHLGSGGAVMICSDGYYNSFMNFEAKEMIDDVTIFESVEEMERRCERGGELSGAFSDDATVVVFRPVVR